MEYNHRDIEPKWQKKWEEQKLHQAEEGSSKPKFYGLIEFPYPSGDGLHVGHLRSNTAMDIICRKRRMQGFNVLYPMGFDAFGLPAENYALKTGVHPKITTEKNIKKFTEQSKVLGFSFDWERSFATTDPDYYKWTQWIFLKLYEKGLAYKDKMAINWCLSCKIGLANEEVVDGKCERCGGEVEKRDKEQWMLKITEYADRLIDDLETVDYLDRIKTQQVNWIGKSRGINFKEKIKDYDFEFEVYDSVPQTFIAQTFTAIAPEHPELLKMVAGTEHEKPVKEFIEKIKKKKLEDKFDLEKECEGIFTGRYVDNPFGTGDLPLWVASFVVCDYGTGIVNCSAHDERDFEFAKKYDIPLKVVMLPPDKKEAKKIQDQEYCYHHAPEGILQEPADFKGMTWAEAREPIIDYIEKNNLGRRATHYKLRDWVFSRQRYWGEPIPMVHCEKCDWVPVPEKDLPVLLPEVEKYEPTDTGESPLAAMKDWVNTTCPKCSGPATRETDTMPNWAGSSWYFLRYCDPKNDKELASMNKLKYWLQPARRSSIPRTREKSEGGVDWYNGGMEHTTLHLLYSRFWHKFLYDIKVVPTSEPYQKRTSHGMVLAEDGEKMSKSRGNVINPDEIVEKYGADTLRMYEMFMGPFGEAIAWSSNTMIGVRRFLEKVCDLFVAVETQDLASPSSEQEELTRLLHKTIKKVSEDIESMKFNTAVSQFMIFVNELQANPKRIEANHLETLLKLLAPFAPHLTEELWEKLGHKESIFKEKWPEYDKNLVKDETIELVIQVNGKVRDKFEASAEISEAEAKEKALASPKVQKWIEGKEVKKVVYVKGRLISIVV